jgi:nitroreductase
MVEKEKLILASIKKRRSVYPKDFVAGKKIDDAIIKEIVELALWAPTHKLTQPWFFKVYRNEGVTDFFAKQSEIYQQITPQESITQRKIEKYKLKAEQVSHVIAVIAQHNTKNIIPEIEETVATACALQNIYLALDNYGIAGYLSTGAVCYSDSMRMFLGLKNGDRCLGFFQLGIPMDDLKQYPRKRISIDEKMEWIG